jgi:hypothetical protein
MKDDTARGPRFQTADLGPAIDFALEVHACQARKGTSTPYVSHPMQVAAIAMEYGAELVQTRAALLHDVLEDGGAPEALRERITVEFGSEVAALVDAASERRPAPDTPWSERKATFLGRLASTPARAKLVIASDKLANVHSLLRDRVRDAAVWRRFRATPAEQVRYFGGCIRELRKGETTPELLELLDELERRTLELAGALLLEGTIGLGPGCPLCGRAPLDPPCPICGHPTRGIVDDSGRHWLNCPDCYRAARERAGRA